MKIVCAWCKQVLGYKCAHCGRELEPDPRMPGHLRCPGEPGMLSPITYGPTSIRHMITSHGICEPCADKLNALRSDEKKAGGLTDEDRANLAQQEELHGLDTDTNCGQRKN
jgi:hypothetical protein